MFSTLSDINFNFWVRIILLSANALNLVESKILSFGKELNGFQLRQAELEATTEDELNMAQMVFYFLFR